MARRFTRYLLPFVLGVAVLGYVVARSSRESPAPERGADADAGVLASIELLEGLKPGDVIDEWTVERIHVTESPTHMPQLAVELVRKGSGITIWVHRKETVHNPPLATERYAFTFGHPRPYGEPIPKDAYAKMMDRIAERVRRTEHTAPVPEGL